MTMRERRGDLTAYPDGDTEDDVLRDFSEGGELTYGYAYNKTIGDLLVDMMSDAEFGPTQQGDNEPDSWETLEHAFMMSTLVQLKAANFCAAHTSSADEEGVPAPALSKAELAMLMNGMAKRLEAGAELCVRLRRARWGHPTFGGGERWSQRKSTIIPSKRKESA